jgi:hypothetical protein
MENVSAYDIALIGGGFTIVGALLATITTYWLAPYLARQNEFLRAASEFRAAFTPTLGALESGAETPLGLQAFLFDSYEKQLKAVSSFEHTVAKRDRASFSQAWKQYHSGQTVDGEPFDRTEYGMSLSDGLFIEYSSDWNSQRTEPAAHLAAKRIRSLLEFARHE